MEKQLIDLFSSNIGVNVSIAIEIMKGKGKTAFEILQFRYKNNHLISDEEAEEAGVLSCGCLSRCLKCGNHSFTYKILDTLNGMTCEEVATCDECKNETYWGYGSWDLNHFS